MTYSSIVYGLLTCIRQQKLWILYCLCPSQTLKQCLVSQFYTNYITKNYLINGLLFQDHILTFHDLPKSQFSTFQDFPDPWEPGKLLVSLSDLE